MVRSPEYNSFEYPSFERMWGNFEWAKEPLPELREATPEQIQKSKEHNTLANRLYQKNSATESLLRSHFEEGFNKNLDTIWRTGEMMIDFSWDKEKSPRIQSKEIPKELEVATSPEKPQMKIEKQSKNPDALGEKEKLITYAKLSDLAYVDFVSVPDPKDLTKTIEKISRVHLDPLAFPNFQAIVEGRIPKDPTEDERIFISYLDTHKNNNRDNWFEWWILRTRNDRKVAPDIADLLRIAAGPRWTETKYASLDEKYRNTIIDSVPNLSFPQETGNIPPSPDVNIHMVDAMEHLRTIKEKQASETLNEIREKGFEIVDYFPNETNTDKTSSWFGAICLKDKAGNMHFAIRWTELSDWWDIVADMRLAMKHVPENQTQDLITFFERNLKNLPEWQKINIAGHSLGWALAQIASVMYPERTNESYTFNSPGAKNLSIDPKGKPEAIRQKFEKFRDFEYNKEKDTVEDRMTNVKGMKWPSIISNLWEDIGNYEIKLEKLSSHSITKLVEYIEKEATNEELERKYMQKKERDTDKEVY